LTVQNDTPEQKSGLDKPVFPVFSGFNFNWEIALYIVLLVLAIVTRFYDLGARVMSHDESLHTLYSWNLYAGKGYSHDPLMHGPFLFHITALMYFLFGDNDFTARMGAALFGVALVILPYWFRPWLGRVGALAASFMILISPGLLYYSRYIRHDIFISVWTVLMFLAFFQYMRTRGNRWVFIGAAAVAFMLSTKEVSFIHGFIGFTFILWAFMWENLSGSVRRLATIIILSVILILVIAMIVLSGMDILPAAGEENGFDIGDATGLLFMITTIVIGMAMVQLGADTKNRPVTAAIKSLGERWMVLLQAAVLGAVIFVLLYTTFFSNIGGLGTGTYGAISYWLSQQDVQRGSQPWYYYLFLVPMYEFLPVLIGLIGGLVYLIRAKGTRY